MDGSSFSAERKAAPAAVAGYYKKGSNNTLPEDTIDDDHSKYNRRSISKSNSNMETETKELSKKRTYGPIMKRSMKEDAFYPESDDAKLTDAVSKDDSVVGNEHVHKKKKKKRAHERYLFLSCL